LASTEVPAEAAADVVVEESTEVVVEESTEVVVEESTEVVAEAAAEVLAEVPADAPAEVSAAAPTGTPADAPLPNPDPAAPTVFLPAFAPGTDPAAFGAGPAGLPAATAAKPRRRGVFLAAWLGSALAVGALTGGGILAATGTSKAATPVAAPSSSPSPSPTVESGVRSDGTHYGPLKTFLLPMPDGFGPGPDEGVFGNDSAVTPDQLDAEMTEIFGKLQASDLTSAKGAMESAHMTQGAVRTYLKTTSDLEFSILALQLDPSMAAKSTGDFLRIVKASQDFRAGPGVPGHPEAQCVLPATFPGDKLDQMTCLATVGDTFVIAQAAGTVPMDQKSITALFANQVDLLKNGPAK
jgi:hypothetical protein